MSCVNAWVNLVPGLTLASLKSNSQVMEKSIGHLWNSLFWLLYIRSQIHWLWTHPLVTCGTHFLTLVYLKPNPQVMDKSIGHLWNSLFSLLYVRSQIHKFVKKVHKSSVELVRSHFVFSSKIHKLWKNPQAFCILELRP